MVVNDTESKTGQQALDWQLAIKPWLAHTSENKTLPLNGLGLAEQAVAKMCACTQKNENDDGMNKETHSHATLRTLRHLESFCQILRTLFFPSQNSTAS